MSDSWKGLHQLYSTQDWIDKPSLFAETAIKYFPATGKVLELGAGQGQDSRYFAEHGYAVTSTDIEDEALEKNAAKLDTSIKAQVELQKVDLRRKLPFKGESFEVVYAHLSLHYFDKATTERIFDDILRVLKPQGILAFFTNSTTDPEYGSGEEIESDYFKIEGTPKRYFSVNTARAFTQKFQVLLLDAKGETYKDSTKGVHNLIRFIGRK